MWLLVRGILSTNSH